MTYSPNSYTTTTEVLIKSATTTGLNVNVLGVTLASGAATSAKQDTQIASLSNIESKIIGLTIVAGRLQVELPSGGGGLTDVELRASPVNVQLTSSSVNISGGIVGISGTVSVTGPLTDSQLRATPIPVSLTSSAVTVSNTVTISPIPTGSNNIGNVGLLYSGTAISLSNPLPIQPPLSGNIPVSQSGTWNVNISAAALPLPTGAATSARQDTQITSLSNIESKIVGLTIVAGRLQVELPTGAGGLTDAELRASPVPVALTSSSVVITSGVVGISGTVSVTGPLTDTQLRASAVPVALTSSSVNISGGLVGISGTVAVTQSGTWNVNVSATALPLPSGAATLLEQQSQTTQLVAIKTAVEILDNAISGNEMQVDVVTLPNVTVADVTASGNITTQNLVPAGTATANSAVEISLAGQSIVYVQVTGTYTGALSAQITVDGSTWVTLTNTTAICDIGTAAYGSSIGSGSTGVYAVPVSGAAKLRITALSSVTGTAVLSLRASRGSNTLQQVRALRVDTFNIQGTTTATGNGVVGGGVQRVAIASDNTPIQAASGTVSTITPTITATTVLAANTNRKSAYFFNDTEVPFFLRLGAGAATNAFTIKIAAGGYYELPANPVYTGIITGICTASTTSSMKITEITG